MKEVKMDPFPPSGATPPVGAHLPRLTMSGPNQVTATAWPMGEMTNWLSRFEELNNRVVVNETGLEGNYDFVLNGISGPAPHPDPAGGAQEPVTSIFTALQEQLGLKLESRRAPVEVLIIDHVERPSSN